MGKTTKKQIELAAKYEAAKSRKRSNIGGIISRIGLAGLGANVLANVAPLSTIAITGKKTLYHGTPLEAIPSITAGEAPGLRLSYAGARRRLNMVLMHNTLHSYIVEKLLKENPELPFGTANDFATILIRNADKKAAEKSGHYLNNFLEELRNSTEGTPLHEFFSDTNNIKKLLVDRGYRIYSGISLPNLLEWSTHANEGSIAMSKLLKLLLGKRLKETSGFKDLSPEDAKLVKKQLRKLGLYSFLDTMTGGLYSLAANDIRDVIRHARMNKEVIKANPEEIARIANELGKKYKDVRPIVEFKAGKEQLKSLKTFADFPGFFLPSNLLTGFRYIVSKVLPNYAPGHDVSFSADVPIDQIKAVHFVVPEENKVIKVVNEAYKNPKALGVSRIIRGAPYLGMGLIGEELLSNAILGKPLLYSYIKNKIKNKGKKKVAAVTSELVKNKALKSALTIGGLSLLSSLVGSIPASMYLAEKYRKNPSFFKEMGESAAQFIPSALIGLPSINLIGKAGPLTAGYSLGNFAGASLPQGLFLGKSKAEFAAKLKPTKWQDLYIKKFLPYSLLGAVMLGYPVYALQGYYGHSIYNLRKMINSIRRLAESVTGADFLKINKPALIVGALAAASAPYIGSYLYYKATNSAGKKREKYWKAYRRWASYYTLHPNEAAKFIKEHKDLSELHEKVLKALK